MSEKFIDLNLTEKCYCMEYSDTPSTWCKNCDGTGEILTENGKELLRFFRKHMFTEIYD